MLRLATLNVMDARNNRLNVALLCMSQMNIDLGILTEMKLSTDKYTKAPAAGYTVVCMKANARKGGVAHIPTGKGMGAGKHSNLWPECH